MEQRQDVVSAVYEKHWSWGLVPDERFGAAGIRARNTLGRSSAATFTYRNTGSALSVVVMQPIPPLPTGRGALYLLTCKH